MPELSVTLATELTRGDLIDLCEATDSAIRDGIGFCLVRPPSLQR